MTIEIYSIWCIIKSLKNILVNKFQCWLEFNYLSKADIRIKSFFKNLSLKISSVGKDGSNINTHISESVN